MAVVQTWNPKTITQQDSSLQNLVFGNSGAPNLPSFARFGNPGRETFPAFTSCGSVFHALVFGAPADLGRAEGHEAIALGLARPLVSDHLRPRFWVYSF